MVKNSPSKLEGVPKGRGCALPQRTKKNSPSKLEGAPEGEGVCLCCKEQQKLSL